MRNIKELTKSNLEGLRREIFHLILFPMAWTLIVEYLLDFRDYALGAGLVLFVIIRLALYSIKLYDLEDKIEDEIAIGRVKKEIRQDGFYALILVFEGMAILGIPVTVAYGCVRGAVVDGFVFVRRIHKALG